MTLTETKWFRLILLIAVALATLVATDSLEMGTRAYRSRIRDPGVIRDYLDSHSVRKLQLGAGGNDPTGWLNTDIEPAGKEVYLDATDRYPFPDGSFQYALAST
jgi:hypothetical protein